MRESLTTVLDLIFCHKSGYVDNPKDPDGATKYGIHTGRWQRTAACPELHLHRSSLISKEETAEIYRRSYWTRSGG